MSDPIAVSILSKLTSWYDFEGNLNDSHGPYPMAGTVAGYQSGLVGQCLKKASLVKATLASTPISNTSGQFSVGFWGRYEAGTSQPYMFGLTTNPGSGQNEALYLSNEYPSRKFVVVGFDASSNSWRAIDPSGPSLRYPFVVRATDANGLQSDLPTYIDVAGSGSYQPGWYFIVATFSDGFTSLYVNGSLKATTNAPLNLKSPIVCAQVGNAYVAGSSAVDIDSAFFSLNGVLTAAEVDWLYNMGQGRSHAQIVGAAA